MPEDRERRNARQAAYMRQRRAAGRAPRKMDDRECADCGVAIRVRAEKPTSRCGTCSRRGRSSAATAASAAARRLDPAERRRRRRARKRAARRPSGYAFVALPPELKTARRRARHADRKARRRARLRAAHVEPVRRAEIFARDGYRCLLCGDSLVMVETVPHPLAPTIDHVIPLAAGGRHAPDNVQAAHFLCNSRKRDKCYVPAMGEGIRRCQ